MKPLLFLLILIGCGEPDIIPNPPQPMYIDITEQEPIDIPVVPNGPPSTPPGDPPKPE